jgi:glycosyltransferase involved in cell wall biosynthesis/peptidoglycan/xylan/chitin deacetylase (PgdA/CDA1 family)
VTGLPSFSIVMPTYNRRDTVCDAVAALGRVDYAGRVELIVVDDGSADGTADALGGIELPFPLTALRQDNAGAARARNHGAAQAKHDILLFLDDDMMVEPGILAAHARQYANGADAVTGHMPLDPASPPGPLSRGVGQWAQKRFERLEAGAPLRLDDVLTGQLSIRRMLFEELGGFDERFTAGGTFGNEDIDLGARLLDRHRVDYAPDAVSRQRYLVSPRDHFRRAAETGAADVAFAAKHPQRLFPLLSSQGLTSRANLRLLRPLARFAPLVRVAKAAGIVLAESPLGRRSDAPRAVERAFHAARLLSYWSGAHRAGGLPLESRLRVLCYHAVAELGDDPVLAQYGIPAARIAAQLDDLQRRGYRFVEPDAVLGAIEGRAGLPRKAVLLTFDDCYAELLPFARDVLVPRGIGALAFAVTGIASKTNEWDQAIGARRLALLDDDGLRALAEQGVEIGSHSRRHRAMPALDEERLAEEAQGSAEDLVAAGLPRPRFFAYPYGAVDQRARTALRDAGYRAAFTLGGLPAELDNDDPLRLPRIEVLARDRGWRFAMKLRARGVGALLRGG